MAKILIMTFENLWEIFRAVKLTLMSDDEGYSYLVCALFSRSYQASTEQRCSSLRLTSRNKSSLRAIPCPQRGNNLLIFFLKNYGNTTKVWQAHEAFLLILYSPSPSTSNSWLKWYNSAVVKTPPILVQSGKIEIVCIQVYTWGYQVVITSLGRERRLQFEAETIWTRCFETFSLRDHSLYGERSCQAMFRTIQVLV